MRHLWVIGWVAAALPAARSAPAQSTDTERAAAREVLLKARRIAARNSTRLPSAGH